MPGRWHSSPAHTLSSCGLLTRWAIGTVGLMPLWMQQQRPVQGAGPLTRPRRPRRAVVRWLSLDSCLMWCYTGLATSHCFHTLSTAALGPAADAVERREKPLTDLVTRWGVSFTGRAARSPCKRWTCSPAVAGWDGRGRGPAEGGRPTLPKSVRGLRCGPAADEMPFSSRPAPTPCGACVVAPLRGRSGWDATAGLACAFVPVVCRCRCPGPVMRITTGYVPREGGTIAGTGPGYCT